MENTFSSYQYKDFLNKENDPYAKAKYKLLLGYIKKMEKNSLHILNAGCGSGDLAILLSRAGHKVVGIDPSEEYIQLARKRASIEGGDNCDFRVGSIEELPETDKYDCVIATDVLEHIKADYTAMKVLSAVTKMGGLIIITVPALEALFGFHDDILGHYRRYSKKTLRRLVESSKNTRIFRLRYFGVTLIPVCYLFSCCLRRVYPYMNSGRANFNTNIQNFILNVLLRIDSLVPMPVGTSLICLAKRILN